MKLNSYKLKQLLDESGKNQSWLAGEMGVSRQVVSAMLKNRPEHITLHKITQIANILDIDPKELIGY